LEAGSQLTGHEASILGQGIKQSLLSVEQQSAHWKGSALWWGTMSSACVGYSAHYSEHYASTPRASVRDQLYLAALLGCPQHKNYF